MTKVFVDTAAWIALINVDDDFHKLAKEVRIKLQQDNCSLVTSNFVFLEVADALTDCISFVIMQQEGITVAFTSDKHFEQAGFTRLLKPII